jgi:hypothetical protein
MSRTVQTYILNIKAFIQDFLTNFQLYAKPVFGKMWGTLVALPDTLKLTLSWVLSMVRVITHFVSKMTYYVTPAFTLKEITTLVVALGFASKILVSISQLIPINSSVMDYIIIFSSQYLLVVTGVLNSFQASYVDLRNFVTNYNTILLDNEALKNSLESTRKTYDLDLTEIKRDLTLAQAKVEALQNTNSTLGAENSQLLRELKELKSTTDWDKYTKILTILSSSLTVGSNMLSLSFSVFDLLYGTSQGQDIRELKNSISQIQNLLMSLIQHRNQDLAQARMSGQDQSSVIPDNLTDITNIGEVANS